MALPDQEVEVRCPECRALVLMPVSVELRRLAFGGVEQTVLEVDSGYEPHECTP